MRTIMAIALVLLLGGVAQAQEVQWWNAPTNFGQRLPVPDPDRYYPERRAECDRLLVGRAKCIQEVALLEADWMLLVMQEAITPEEVAVESTALKNRMVRLDEHLRGDRKRAEHSKPRRKHTFASR